VTNPTPITDSPWFWVLVYSTVPLVGLAALSHQYQKRQGRLERQFQGHMAAAERRNPNSAGELSSQPNVPAQPPKDGKSEPPDPIAGETIIPLAPLVVLFFAIACVAGVMLIRDRRRQAVPDAADPSNSGSDAR
jgi:hypothetical protein